MVKTSTQKPPKNSKSLPHQASPSQRYRKISNFMRYVTHELLPTEKARPRTGELESVTLETPGWGWREREEKKLNLLCEPALSHRRCCSFFFIPVHDVSTANMGRKAAHRAIICCYSASCCHRFEASWRKIMGSDFIAIMYSLHVRQAPARARFSSPCSGSCIISSIDSALDSYATRCVQREHEAGKLL